MSARKTNVLCYLTALICASPILADDLEAGRAFYDKGRSLHPVEVRLTGGIEANATAFPCKSCHGSDGRGGIEGGVSVPPINWRELSRPLPGSGKTAYDESLLYRALSQGMKSDGRPMHRLMPRYDLSEADFGLLVEHLKHIDNPMTPGVGDNHLKIGVVLSEAPELDKLVQEVQVVFSRYFQQLNVRGGVHGRRIELVFTPPTGIDEAVLCYLTGPLMPEEASALGQKAKVTPILFPLSEINGQNGNSVPILPGLADQLAQLIAFSEAQPSRVLIADDDRLGSLIRHRFRSTAGDEARTRIITSLAELPAGTDEPQHIFWFTGQQEFGALIAALSKHTKRTVIYSSLDLLGGELLRLPRLPHNIDLLLSNPRGVPELSSIDYQDYLTFTEANRLSTQHPEWNRMVYLVSTLTHEALKRSSRRITRQRLLDAANSFYQFPVGVTHPITTVDENTRRSQLLRFDAAARRLLPI